MSSLDDQRALEALTKEFGSEAAAHAALDDLRASMPQSVDAWRDATRIAHDGRNALRRWLFILPENHSLVGIYPLAMAAAARLDVSVRVPTRFAAKDSFLMIYIEDLKRAGAKIEVLPPAFRIVDDKHGFEAILAYGDDATIAGLRAIAGCPVQGFGARFGVSVVDAATLDQDVHALARDFMSLGQSGCMASRIGIVIGDVDPATLATRLGAAARDFWQSEVPWRERVGLDVEAFRLSRLGFAVWPGDVRTPIVATRMITTKELSADTILAALATRPFTLPVLIVNEGNADFIVKTAVAPLLSNLSVSVATLSRSLAKSHYRSLSFQVLGRANSPAWDGHHETRELFRPH